LVLHIIHDQISDFFRLYFHYVHISNTFIHQVIINNNIKVKYWFVNNFIGYRFPSIHHYEIKSRKLLLHIVLLYLLLLLLYPQTAAATDFSDLAHACFDPVAFVTEARDSDAK